MARPTTYSEEILQAARNYALNWKAIDPEDVLPTIEGLAIHIGVHRDTIYDWKSQEDKREFSDIVTAIMNGQSKTLINKGLKGDFNAPITKLMLSKHGYAEKTETDITTKGESIASPTSNVARIAEEVAKKLKEQKT